jgi:murein hydrolase activator
MLHLRPRGFACALLAASALLWAPHPLAAQTQPATPEPKAAVQDNGILKAREQELEAARNEQRRAAEAEKKLRAEIDTLGEDRRKLVGALIETAARLRDAEATLTSTEERIKPLEDDERAMRKSLSDRRELLADVLAALQRMGRRPPPALLVGPEDAAKSVRSAIVLGAVLPELRAQAETLATDLSKLVKLREELNAGRSRLAANIVKLNDERQRMSLLVEERQRKQGDTEKALQSERLAATALATQVDNLKDLIGRLETGLDSANKAARAAARAADDQKNARTDLAALTDPGRLAPLVAFASARGRLPMPVNGVKLRDYGVSDGVGGTERGLTIATRAGAQVTSPCDGWVVYAGPFRSYGQLLILNAGDGYHVLLAGMERISVDIGQFVLTGEPVAAMGSGASQTAATIPMGSSQPALYVEFRKDGSPVDPGPWWARKESEKVRG